MENGSSQQQPAQPGWQFTPDQPGTSNTSAQPQMTPPPAPVSSGGIQWSASEFVAHHKSAGWYLILFGGAALLCVVVYIVTRDILGIVMITLIAIAFAVAGARKPRTLQYQVNNNGIQIGAKSYSFREFKSFTVIEDDAINYIDLMPLKRFLPAISLHYEPKDESKIADILNDHLPFEHVERDSIDRFLHKIGF